MGRRRNTTIEIAERPKTKLSARVKQRILKLHDTPFTPGEISRELTVPVSAVKQALREMVPADVGRWLEL